MTFCATPTFFTSDVVYIYIQNNVGQSIYKTGVSRSVVIRFWVENGLVRIHGLTRIWVEYVQFDKCQKKKRKKEEGKINDHAV